MVMAPQWRFAAGPVLVRPRDVLHTRLFWYNSGTVYSLQTILSLRKLCKLTFLLQIEVIHRLIRFCTPSKISGSLRLSNSWMPYYLASLSIWNSLSSPCTNILSGAGESLTIWHHMILTIPWPAELWGLITHILVYGIAPGWWDDRKIITSLCCLYTFACWIFPTISAVHFLAFAILAITFRSKECVITEKGGE